jgi:hypothetical protein
VDDPDVLAARARLRALGPGLEEHVAEQVASFPPITDEQAEQVARLLWGTVRFTNGK